MTLMAASGHPAAIRVELMLPTTHGKKARRTTLPAALEPRHGSMNLMTIEKKKTTNYKLNSKKQ
jgi:hypothetical protein